LATEAKVAAREPLKPGTETVFVDLRLENDGAEPRWLVLRSNLQDPLAESFRSALVHACGFDAAPDVPYLQAQGPTTGFVAFRLAPGASLQLERFAFRARGGEGFELWDVSEIRSDGEAVAVGVPLEGALNVPTAFRRVTNATLARGAEVELDVEARRALDLA
jgi:hypothetical protein